MRNVKSIDWQRALTEGVVIVFSILLAFWIDAWWSQREEDQRVDSLLHALEEEWAENFYRIDEAIPKWDEVIERLARRVNASLQDVDSLTPEQVQEIWEETSFDGLPYFNPSMGAWNAVVEVGLSGIDDVELSSAIAAWPSHLGQVTIAGDALYSILETGGGRVYSEFLQSRKVRVNTENGLGQYDSDRELIEIRRALLHDENRVVSWRQGARAAGFYRSKLEQVRSQLQSDLELLRSKLDD
jgi:hypothetical protein